MMITDITFELLFKNNEIVPHFPFDIGHAYHVYKYSITNIITRNVSFRE